MKSIYELQQTANRLRAVTEADSISPEDTFGLQSDVLAYIAGMEQNADGLGIRKVYVSVAAMNADNTTPIGINGKVLRLGQLVTIYDPDSPLSPDTGNIYAFQKPGWKLVGHTMPESKFLRLLQGIDENNSAYTDPFVFLGEYSEDLHGADYLRKFNDALDSLCGQAEDASLSRRWTGNVRATVDGRNIDIHQYVTNFTSRVFTQIIEGNVAVGDDGMVLLSNNYASLIRSCNGGEWTPWQAVALLTDADKAALDVTRRTVDIRRLDALIEGKNIVEILPLLGEWTVTDTYTGRELTTGRLTMYVDSMMHQVTQELHGNYLPDLSGHQDLRVNVLRRSYGIRAGGDGGVAPGEFSPWTYVTAPLATEDADGSMSAVDKRLLASIVHLGEFSSKDAACNWAARAEVAGNKRAALLLFTATGATGARLEGRILQMVNGESTSMQFLMWDKRLYRRNVTGATGREGDTTNAYGWEEVGVQKMEYNSLSRQLSLKSYENGNVANVTLSLATNSVPGLMSAADKQKIDDMPEPQDTESSTSASRKYVYSVNNPDAKDSVLNASDTFVRQKDGLLMMQKGMWNPVGQAIFYTRNRIPVATTGADGAMAKEVFARLGAGSTIYEGTATITTVPIIYPNWAEGGTRTLTLNPATTARAGVMTAYDKQKLDELYSDRPLIIKHAYFATGNKTAGITDLDGNSTSEEIALVFGNDNRIFENIRTQINKGLQVLFLSRCNESGGIRLVAPVQASIEKVISGTETIYHLDLILPCEEGTGYGLKPLNLGYNETNGTYMVY